MTSFQKSIPPLREYQGALVGNTRRALAQHKRVIMLMATGGGKTITFLHIIRMALEAGRTVLVLTESRKIFKQIVEQQHGRLIAQGTHNFTIQPGGVFIAMAQTLKLRPDMLRQFNELSAGLLVINDEAHIGTANKVLFALTNAWIIGVTATPDARVAPHIPKLYPHVVLGPQPYELVSAGYLAPYKHFERQIADLSGLVMKGNEYTEQSLDEAFDTRTVFEGMLEDLRAFEFKKGIIFTASIKHCEHVYEQLIAAGYDCACVHSGREDSELRLFTDGSATLAVSVGQITKGFDYPPADLIVLDRKIGSLPLYLQCIGRGSRTHPGKQFFTVLDYGQNFSYHGSWIVDRDWSALAQPRKKKDKVDVAPVKNCPRCECVLPASARICMFCGYAYEAPEVEPELPASASVLVEVTENSNKVSEEQYLQLKNKSIKSLTAHELSIYARARKKNKFATLLARYRDLQEPGYLKEFIACMGYKPSFYYVLEKSELSEFSMPNFKL